MFDNHLNRAAAVEANIVATREHGEPEPSRGACARSDQCTLLTLVAGDGTD